MLSERDHGEMNDAMKAEAIKMLESLSLDSVEIVATFTDTQGTHHIHKAGAGNLFARIGSLHEAIRLHGQLNGIADQFSAGYDDEDSEDGK